MRKHLVLSMLLHLSLLLLMVTGGGGNGKGKHPEDKVSVSQFQPAPQKQEEPVEVEIVHDDMGFEEKQPKRKKTAHKDCKGAWYGGIGISYGLGDYSSMRVGEVAPGYSADKMGIKVGDVVESKTEIRGEPGTMVEITVHSNGGTSRTFKIMREKICYESPTPEQP